MPLTMEATGDSVVTITTSVTSSSTGDGAWPDVRAIRNMIAKQERVWAAWNGTTSAVTGDTLTWPAEWIDTGTSCNTITWGAGNTDAANAVWALDCFQNGDHSEIRWTPTICRGAPKIIKTAEEIAHEAAQRERRRQIRLRQNQRLLRFKQAANVRARGLLMQMLNSEQRAELDDKNHFHLTVHSRDGSMKVYRIDYGFAGNVKLLGADGKPVRSYCIHSDSRLPYEDQMLAQKLMLESDEKKFLRIANETIVRRAA